MNEDDVEKQAQEIMRSIEGLIPREIQGILIMGLIMLAVVGIVWYIRRWRARRAETPDTGRGVTSSGGGRRKTRKLAIAAGFEVEDVQRDAPEFGKGMIYSMMPKKCARYTWTGDVPAGVKWSLLCRPEEESPGIGVRGWLLQANRAEITDGMKSAVAWIAHELGEPAEFFEIEVADQKISFYWMDKGGQDAVDRLLVFAGRIRMAA